MTHGTRSAYVKYQCRCEDCCAANTAYHQQLRRLKAYDRVPLGRLVNAKEAGQHLRHILVEHYTRHEFLQSTGLERHMLPKLTATHLIRFKTLLRIRRTARILLGTPYSPIDRNDATSDQGPEDTGER